MSSIIQYYKYYKEEFLVLLVAAFIFYIGLVVIWIKTNRHLNDKYENNKCYFFLLIGYGYAILWFTVLCRVYRKEMCYKIVLFESYYDFFLSMNIKILLQNMCNIIMFIPVGLFNGLNIKAKAMKNKMLYVISVGVLFSLTIELLQLFLHRGWFEMDDILHNTIGCYLGYALSIKISKKQE